MVRQKAILDLALQFDDACIAKDDLRKAYEKCNDIPQESRALIDNFLKEGSDKDYELNLSMYRKATKIEKQLNAKLKVVEDVGEDENFKSGTWVSATDYVNANGGTVTGCLGDIKNFLKNGKLDQVIAIVKSCSPYAIGDLTMTMKDLYGTITGTIYYKVIGDGSYGKNITVGAALILANVSVFSLLNHPCITLTLQ
ncbi:RNA-directed DNA polymerase, eukaryota [Tanacetum coccineum]|uniref:RNA-directed DNA polymerase, eukaryota n=1 Tax=Tanacetum coccineum TaxID=301880 RepID=A0ABQ5EFL4_9ASTR